MESWELFIPYKPQGNKNKKGQFIKGNVPHNKGKKWSEWMSDEGAKKVLSGLRHTGRIPGSGGDNRQPIAGVNLETKKVCFFESMIDASRKTGVCYYNIIKACRKKRKTAGGCKWFCVDDVELKQYL